jgi:SOS response associated peptidase (SRAP)
MCGRYTLKTPVEHLSEMFQFPEIIPLKPRYNIAPSQSVAVVRQLPDDTDRTLAMLRWGLLPAWVKDPTEPTQPITGEKEETAEALDELAGATGKDSVLAESGRAGEICGGAGRDRTAASQFCRLLP